MCEDENRQGLVFGPLETWRVGVKSSVSKYKRDFESALETREQRKVEHRKESD